MTVFSCPLTIRFQHCDPAGIVFYPRYYEMYNLVVEMWFEEVLGLNFRQMHETLGMGIPVVHIETRFPAASYLSDRVDFTLSISRLSQKSATVHIEGKCDEELRCVSDQTIVCMDMKCRKSQTWPQQIRLQIQQYQGETNVQF